MVSVSGDIDGFQTEVIESRDRQAGGVASRHLAVTCRMVNVCESGIRVQSRLFVKNGDALHLSIDLDGGRQLNCEIRVTNVRSPHFGATIVSISPEDRERLVRILDDHLQSSFSRG